jgi:hypothetical protein
MATASDLAGLQLDPISVVAPNHLLVLWSRLGRFDPAEPRRCAGRSGACSDTGRMRPPPAADAPLPFLGEVVGG